MNHINHLNVSQIKCKILRMSIASIRRVCTCRLLQAQYMHFRSTTDQKQPSDKTVKFPNPIKVLYPWKSKEDFVEFMRKSIFFNYDGIIGLNKPYGVGLYSRNQNEPYDRPRLTRTLIPETKFTIEDAVPGLREHLKLKDLCIMKSTERFTSGVCLMAANEDAAKAITKTTRRDLQNHVPNQSFWAITRGFPVPPVASQMLGYKLVENEGKDLEPELVLSPSKRSIKMKQLVKLVNVEHRILSSCPNLGVALCQVDTTSNKAHFVRFYLTHHLSCILGDTLFSSRLRTVLGRTILMDPKNCNRHADPFPSLSNQVKKNLCVVCPEGDEMAHIPVMLHLRTLVLPKWKKHQDLVLTAPLPEHFTWACQNLNLDNSITAD